MKTKDIEELNILKHLFKNNTQLLYASGIYIMVMLSQLVGNLRL